MDHDNYAVVLVEKIGDITQEIYFKTVEDYISYEKSVNSVNVKETAQIDLITTTNKTKEKVYITKDNWKDLGLKAGDKISIDGVFTIQTVEANTYEGDHPFCLDDLDWLNLTKFKYNLYKVEE